MTFIDSVSGHFLSSFSVGNTLILQSRSLYGGNYFVISFTVWCLMPGDVCLSVCLWVCVPVRKWLHRLWCFALLSLKKLSLSLCLIDCQTSCQLQSRLNQKVFIRTVDAAVSAAVMLMLMLVVVWFWCKLKRKLKVQILVNIRTQCAYWNTPNFVLALVAPVNHRAQPPKNVPVDTELR